MSEFQAFDKLARWSRNVVITEKIDGSNAQVCITPIIEESFGDDMDQGRILAIDGINGLCMRAGARNGWVVPEKARDNFGFAAWVKENSPALFALGAGRHFGEWWGAGIQRRYGLTEKRFSLFNVSRWTDERRPSCCHVVPTLYSGPLEAGIVEKTLADLAANGSAAAPGFMDPEGIVVFHTASNSGFKKTIKNDSIPKSVAERMGLAA